MADLPAEDAQTAICRAVLDALPDPVLIYDDSCVLYANAAANRILGGSEPSKLLGMSVENFILPDLAEINNARRAYVLNQGVEIRDLILKIRDLEGRPTVLRVDIKPIRFDGATVAMATLAHR